MISRVEAENWLKALVGGGSPNNGDSIVFNDQVGWTFGGLEEAETEDDDTDSFYTQAEVDALLDSKSDLVHTHQTSEITGLEFFTRRNVVETISGIWEFDNGLKTDEIFEKTVAAGVMIDGVLVKDGTVTPGVIETYTVTNGSDSRSFDATAVSVTDLAHVVYTLLKDLTSKSGVNGVT